MQDSYESINSKLQDARKTVKSTEDKIKEINEQIHYTRQYLANKPVYGQMLKSRNKKRFRQEHSSEISLYENAVKFLKNKYPDGKIPSMKMMKEEKEHLTLQKAAQLDTYNYFNRHLKCTIDISPFQCVSHFTNHIFSPNASYLDISYFIIKPSYLKKESTFFKKFLPSPSAMRNHLPSSIQLFPS